MSDLPVYLVGASLLLFALALVGGGFAAGWAGRGGAARDALAREQREAKRAAAGWELAHTVWDRARPHLPPQDRAELARHFEDQGRHSHHREA